jgi:hypothetical protein
MFNIPEIISLGSFVVPLHYLLFVVIGYSATYFVRLKSRALDSHYKTRLEILLAGLFAYIIVWKLSFILFDPLSIIKNMSVIIYGSGGFTGNILGIIIGIIFTMRSAKKFNYSFLLFLDLLS